MDIAALAISVLALFAAGGAAWYTRSQRDQARRQADISEAADLRLKYGWRIERVSEGMFVLRNIGWASARQVSARSDPSLSVEFEHTVAAVDLEPQQGVPFIAMLVDIKAGMSIDITWTPSYQLGGKVVVEKSERTWREPLPALPIPSQKLYGR
jgi:hypothetical protein